MKLFFTLVCLLVIITGRAQTAETHNFTTYDTSISIAPCSICAPDKWNVRISRPVNMFKAGDADTASRPAIITMPGQGELGVNDLSKLEVYGPHYWLNNGWDGGVTLSNGKHYPILITVCYLNNVYPTAPAYYNLLSYLLKTYHIKRNSVHLAGLSQGAFSAGALIMFEQTAGDETGMKLVTTLTCFEGTPDPLPAPYSTWSRGFTAYQVWASKYGGRYFYLEGSGSDNFRDGWQYANAMNQAVPNSAYFSYENLGGGAHCCWNSMYDPKATNWTCAPATALGPNNAPSQAGTNQMGDYKAPSSVFQWMLQHGDTSLVGGAKSSSTTPPVTLTPVSNAGGDQTITLPTSSVTLTGSGTETGGVISSYAWTQVSGPSTATIATAAQATTTVSALVAGTYIFQLKVTDANGATATDQVNVVVNPAASSGSSGTTYQAVPGTIQAESYATMSGIATETTTDAGGGQDVGWIDAGDLMTYNVNVASAGAYTASFRVASINTGASFKVVDAKGATLATVTVPNTGGWQVWATVNATVTLSAGQQAIKVVSQASAGWNINWMQFALQVATPPASTPSAPSGKVIPGTVQAEDYDAMIGIATETTSDTGGGKDVGWLGAVGNQMSYNVTVSTAGTYTVNFRIASPNNGASFKVLDTKNNILTTVNVPNTGGWQVWSTITSSVTLPAGAQTIKVVSLSANGFNFNWMQFVSATTTAAASTVSRHATASSFGVDQSSDVTQPEHVSVYPNPAGDQVVLDIANSATGPVKIKIINAVGVTVRTYQWTKEGPSMQQSLSLSGLPTGLYFIRMQAEGWSETRKILKK